MAKRNRPELTVVATTSHTSGYGGSGSQVWKGYSYLHPIWKAAEARQEQHMSEDQDAAAFAGSLVINRGYYHLHPLWKTTLASENDESNELESRSPCPFSANLYEPLNWRCEQIVSEASLLGQLDSQKFESYIEIIWRRLSKEKKKVFTCLDSLWFSLYTRGPLKQKVLDWIKKKNIFSKRYVFVPIVLWNHWFLLILCHFDESSEPATQTRCMLLLDSLQKANSKLLEPEIRRFVQDIFQAEERPKKDLICKIPLQIPKVPQQRKGEECGFYVLYYINLFLQSDLDNFCFSSGNPHFMKEDWFSPAEIECFIRSLDLEKMNGHASSLAG